MPDICIYFQVHQPFRLRWFWPHKARMNAGEIKKPDDLHNLYFDNGLNKWTFQKVANKCYFPTNNIILNLIDDFKSEKRKFKLSYSLTGTFIEQCEQFSPELLDTFKDMQKSGCVEFLGETYYHSLASLFEDKTEFIEEVEMHRQLMKDVLNVKPKIFRNTELLYNNETAREAKKLGFKAMLAEGIEWVLDDWKSPNYVYESPDRMKILLRNYKFSDDVGYRFSAKWWTEHPLTADKYASWLSKTPGDMINLFMDYETFGEHQWADTGILEFLKNLPGEILKYDNLEFSTPSEIVNKFRPAGVLDIPWFKTFSWADLERDTSAWIGGYNQKMCFNEVQHLGWLISKSKNPGFKKLWRYLLTSDHFHYMSTKGMGDGSVHEYFSHHGNPYDAAINYLAVLSDLKEKVLKEMGKIK
ncbi:alpha-amylase [Candidatus Altiarchaeales archaeon WOR_SM1_SCG]|nr:alpha-amylase [Candidatus Altiarchaeales archaeon WOR_SM1_SCG]